MTNTNISNLNLTKGTIPPLLKYKIVFLGDQAVGKSSIINRFIYDIFDGNQHRPTIGIDFISQNIFLQDKTIRLQLWDTAGQQRFRALIPNYIRDCTVAVIVYDVSSSNSFQSIQKWIDDVKNQRGQDVIIALLANKIDLQDTRQVTYDDGAHLAQINQIIFKEVSAKSGVGIQQFFKDIAALLPQVNGSSQGRGNLQKDNAGRAQNSMSNGDRIQLNNPSSQQNENEVKKKKKGCC